MRHKRVSEILLPYEEGVSVTPSVEVDERITHAVEVMVNHNLKSIAVVKNERPVGMIRLEDAFEKLGLRAWRVSA